MMMRHVADFCSGYYNAANYETHSVNVSLATAG